MKKHLLTLFACLLAFAATAATSGKKNAGSAGSNSNTFWESWKEKHDFYLVGTHNDWNNTSERYAFEKNENNKMDIEYMLNLTLMSSNDEFKIIGRDDLGDWNKVWGKGDGNYDSWFSLSQPGANIKPEKTLRDVTIYIKVNENGNPYSMYIEGTNTNRYTLHSQVNGNWGDKELIQTGEDIYTALITASNAGSGGIMIFDQNDTYYKSNGSPLSTSNPVEFKTTNNSNGNFSLTPGKTYVFIWEPKESRLSVQELPSNLYIYGHLNNKAWSSSNFVEMRYENNKFVADNVNISGIFDENDAIANPKNVAGENTYDQNYIAFFSEKIASGNRSDYENINIKWGALEKNVPVYSAPATEKIQKSTYNYMVAEGIYRVEVDFINGEASFLEMHDDYEPSKYEVAYQWHNGDGSLINYEENQIHPLTYGEDNIIQVGVNGNEEHRVAKAAVFIVEKKNNSSAALKRGVMKLADDNYSEAVQGKDYQILNNNNNVAEDHAENVNNKIQLLTVGDYRITATLPDDSNAAQRYNADDAVMYASVQAANVEVTADNQDEEFNPNSNTYTLSVSFHNSEISTSDFNLTIAPQNNAEGWVKLSDYQTEGGSVDAAYEAALYSDLYNHQYLQLVGNGNYIDGFYTELSDPKIINVNGEVTITQEFPCSGVYEMTISPIENGNYYFDTKVATFTITPNLKTVLKQTYENDGQSSPRDASTFNINGYGFTAANTETINYPGSIATVEELKKSVAYKPGIYFDDSFTITFGDVEYSDPGVVDGPSALADESSLAKNTNWIDFDFSALANSSGISVKATIVKNGATGTNKMIVVNNSDTETGVETVEAAEDGEAVYYNLQGVRIENPTRGIFVRVVGGKVEKVVL